MRVRESVGGQGGDRWRPLFVGSMMIGVLAVLVTLEFLFG
jgi:hypothetical protein